MTWQHSQRIGKRAANYIEKKSIPEGRADLAQEKREKHNRATRDMLGPAGKSGEMFSPRHNPSI